ncbi:DoxX family protein [Paenibacillus vulneris]|uniref:DoxX family protein n=1 Tax=Paenibacillus vulneris TaxID=1133364 RepID=A0ABW3URN9_9BACL
MTIVIILQVLLGAFFMMTGTKIINGKMSNEFKRFGLPPVFNFLTGFIEIVGSIGMIAGIWLPVAAWISGLLLGSTMLVAALILLFIARDPVKNAIPAIILCILSFTSAGYHLI